MPTGRNRTVSLSTGAMFIGVITGALCVGAGSGCDTAAADLRDAFRLDAPSPSEAAMWMFDNDPERRRRGISLISNSYFGGEEVYLEVYRESIIDSDPLVRAAAAHALGLHGDPTDAPALAELLNDSSPHVRWEATKALQRLHNPVAIQPLLDRLNLDDDPDVRMAAANALGQYAEARVVESLIAALDDPSLTVNHHALRSLRILTGQDHGYEPSAWLAWYRGASAPFSGRGRYRYPVFFRDYRFLEQIFPINRPVFESPASPVGLPASDKMPDATKPANGGTSASETTGIE